MSGNDESASETVRFAFGALIVFLFGCFGYALADWSAPSAADREVSSAPEYAQLHPRPFAR